MKKTLIWMFCLLITHTAGSLAQVVTTTGISGTVTDPTAGVVPGVEVVLKNQQTGATWQAVSNESGFYSFPSLPPGIYTVTAGQPGFKTAVITDRTVKVGQPAGIDIRFEIGEAKESITVSAAGAELINTQTAEISGTVSSTLIKSVPLNAQNIFNLAALTPGISPQHLGQNDMSFAAFSSNVVTAAGTYASTGVFAGGMRDLSANVSVDGANVQSARYGQTTQLQSPATVMEVRVQSGNMNAEFGNGITAVNVITKHGTNEYHGEIYWFLRNDNLDATPFFTNLAGRDLPEYKQNQYGFTFGGPLIRDKLQFFGGYESLVARQTLPTFAIVPPAELRQGDFSNYNRPRLPNGELGPAPTIYDPNSFNPQTGLRQPFLGNKIPQSAMDPVILKYLEFTPLPNTVIDGIPRFAGVDTNRIDKPQVNLRLDWNKSSATHIYGRYTRDHRKAFNVGLLPFAGSDNSSRSTSYVAHWAQSFGGRAFNDFQASVTQPSWVLGRRLDGGDVSAQIGLKNTSALAGAPNASVPGGFAIAGSGSFVLVSTQNTYQLKDDFSLVKGRHTFRFGVQITQKRLYWPRGNNDKGHFTFGSFYSAACPAGRANCDTARQAAGLDQGGAGFADFLLGAPRFAFVELPGARYDAHQSYLGFYAQDSFPVRPRLTLNYGLRYEFWMPWLHVNNITGRFERSTGEFQYVLQNPLDYLDASKCFGKCAPLNTRIPRQGISMGMKNFAPRVGLAYLLTPVTTIRLGGGIFYDANWNGNEYSAMHGNLPPFTRTFSQQVAGNEQQPPLLVRNMFPVPPPTAIAQPDFNPPFSLTALGQGEYKPTTVYQWSLSVQRRFGKVWGGELYYLGSHTIRQFQFVFLNPANLPVGPLADKSLQERRIFRQWGNIQGWLPIGWAKYNAFTASLTNNGWRGLTVMANYTWAKNIVSANPAFSEVGIRDFRRFDQLAGPSSFTAPHRFVTGWSYELPFGRGKRLATTGVPGAILGGWAISGITEFSLGIPMRLVDDDFTGTGEFNGPPNHVPGCDPSNVPGGKSRLAWFNTQCFEHPPFGTFGNASLGVLTAPGINNWDISIARMFPVKGPGEKTQLEFRLEAFNAFNHTQWRTFNNSMTSATFGRITDTRPARQLQFVLKYLF